jgi:hypothetical protein
MPALLDEKIDRLSDGAPGGVLDWDDSTGSLPGAHCMEDLGDRRAGKALSFRETTQGDKMGKGSLRSKEGDSG